jgi:hypothetical protein
LQEEFDQDDLRDLYYSRKVFAKINGTVQEVKMENSNSELTFEKDTTPHLDLRGLGLI